MKSKRIFWIFGAVLLAVVLVAAFFAGHYPALASQNEVITETDSSASVAEPSVSHRLIVQLDSPSLSEYALATRAAWTEGGRIDFKSPEAQAYIAQLETEQAAFVNQMKAALPAATVSQYINELGAHVDLTYQVTFNGMAIDPGTADLTLAAKTLLRVPGVKAVFRDYAHQPDLYASLPLINASAAWDNSAIGGMENAGAGIKVASMDGGAHHEAPMFDGTGYSYPPDYPPNGLGLTANNNGKIIASRAYFRAWDPPSAGDENPWPGTQGTPHGTHTASTAAGNEVVATYLGITETISGVAPNAWVMSYRVFYNSITNDGSFYTAEGIAALEDILMDGADALNNSWGGGPGSVGGAFDPLDTALINVANAGTFVSMSAGNAGPYNGTTDHPSSEYIGVAASTTDGTLASGQLNIIEPQPVVSATLQDIPFGLGLFGAPLPIGTVATHTYMTAESVDFSNIEGCSPWTGTPFTGHAALIKRGTCNFSQKVYYAEQAGAEFVVIYNNAGDSTLNMSPGDFADQVTISSIFVGQTNGEAMEDWYDMHGLAAVLELDTTAFQAGNTPDFLASFSSRGPGVGNVLKPDITAPGVNILAQGYTPGATGEDRHLGWGQVSGTSMAAPHVTGAAALLRQIHPGWSNDAIKSALMSTSKYIGIWNGDGSHAQPLDMGAGRLDLTYAADPGVILDPPSVSFGQVVSGSVSTIDVMVTSVATGTETYNLSTLLVGGVYPTPTMTSTLPGFSVTPTVVTLDAGETAMVSVTFDSSQGSIGDNQGFVVMDGAMHDAHMPVWARVAPAPTGKVLIIQNDFSYLLGFPDYLSYYTETLDNMGVSYDVWNADVYFNNPSTIPEAAVLSAYDAVIYFTGDNFFPNGTFTVATPLTTQDMDRLTEYANGGGVVIAMGQDMSSVLNDSFFDDAVLGGDALQDSVSGFDLPSLPVTADPNGPAVLQGVTLDLSGPSASHVTLTGAQEVPPVATDAQGDAYFWYNAATGQLDYKVTVTTNHAMTITASHIHDGAAGVPGPVLYPLYAGPTLVTDTFTFAGSVVISTTHEAALLAGDTYINVHSTDNPGGELRAQVEVAVNGDGAGNQYFVDELSSTPNTEPDGQNGKAYSYMALLQYAGPYNLEQGTVAMAHREQPTLEVPGVSYLGRSIYTTFGLEGVNNGVGTTSREDLLGGFFLWALDEPTATISDTTPTNGSNMTTFAASLSSGVPGTYGVSYRWDFGDGTPYTAAYESNQVSHTYAVCGTFTVRVEATDSWGNKAIGELTVDVTNCTANIIYLPVIRAGEPAP